MSDYSQGPGWWQASDGKWYAPEQAQGVQMAAPAVPIVGDPYGQGTAVAPAAWGAAAPAYGGMARGPVGQVRSPWAVLGLSIITLGIYGLVWQYKVFQEMKDYSGQGVGGGLALVLALFVGFVNVFLMPAEVGNLYALEGQEKPVSGATGCWQFLLIIGSFVWLWKVQGRLNDFWRAHGATG